jgi:hypothetical protein
MELITGNPQVFHVAAYDEDGALMEVAGFAVTATDAEDISTTPTVGSFDATLGYPVTLTPESTLVSPLTVIATGSGFRRVYTFGLIDVEQSLNDYGSVAEVQSYVGALVRINQTSNPSSNEIVAWLAQESLKTNLLLQTAGYVTPVTDATIRLFLCDIVNRLAVARVFERAAAVVNPTYLDRVEQWRGPARDDLEQIRCGALLLPGATRDTSATMGRTPSVTTWPAAITSNRVQRFVDNRSDK